MKHISAGTKANVHYYDMLYNENEYERKSKRRSNGPQGKKVTLNCIEEDIKE